MTGLVPLPRVLLCVWDENDNLVKFLDGDTVREPFTSSARGASFAVAGDDELAAWLAAHNPDTVVKLTADMRAERETTRWAGRLQGWDWVSPGIVRTFWQHA